MEEKRMFKKISLNDFTDKIAGMNEYNSRFEGDNTQNRKKMLQMIEKVANGELTSRQKECLFMYYAKDMKMCEISDVLGICISCVSRHIKKAKQKIQKTMAYYYAIK